MALGNAKVVPRDRAGISALRAVNHPPRDRILRDWDHNLALPGPKLSTVETSIKSEGGWWAGQDSNLQPDRYERPALTIELPARLGARREG